MFQCYRSATAQHPENAGEVLEGFLLSLSFLSFFSLGFGPLNIALQKTCLRETQEEPIIREELGAGGFASQMSQTHGAWLKSFVESPKDLQKILLWNAILGRVPKIMSFNMCVGVFFVLPLYNLPLKSLSFCKGPELYAKG